MQINILKFRAWLGWFAILLPIIVLIMCSLYGYGIPDSISATYYIPTCITPFMIILGLSSIFLIFYTGYDKHDDIICTITGIAGLFICLFPCNTEGLIKHWDSLYIPELIGTFQLLPAISGLVHNISALIFFSLLAYNSYFLFTKSSGVMTDNKRKRNIIYKICGIGMVSCLIFIIPISVFKLWGGTWLIETIALFFFGLSWLTKSDIYKWLFCDIKN